MSAQTTHRLTAAHPSTDSARPVPARGINGGPFAVLSLPSKPACHAARVSTRLRSLRGALIGQQPARCIVCGLGVEIGRLGTEQGHQPAVLGSHCSWSKACHRWRRQCITHSNLPLAFLAKTKRPPPTPKVKTQPGTPSLSAARQICWQSA